MYAALTKVIDELNEKFGKGGWLRYGGVISSQNDQQDRFPESA